MHFDFRPLFRITFAELSRKYPYSQTPAISRGCTEGKAKTRGLGVWLSQSLTFGNLATATRILWCPSPAGPRAGVGGRPLHIMIIIPNFRETFVKENFTFANSKKNFREGFQHNIHGFRNENSLQGPLDRSPYIIIERDTS